MDDRFAIGMAQLVLASCVGTVTSIVHVEGLLYAAALLSVGVIWCLAQSAVELYEWSEENGYKPDGYRTILFTGVCMACIGMQAGVQAMNDYTFTGISIGFLGIGAVFMVGGYYEQ